ncbi:MAG: DUF6807 family protein [Cyclobacteriaceae bacterium]
MMKNKFMIKQLIGSIGVIALVFLLAGGCTEDSEVESGEENKPEVKFDLNPGELLITIGDEPFATYSFEDTKITRPFFANVNTPCGIQATRNFPPQPEDPQDHDTMHPGIWLSFGDINGNDYWRNKAKVEHEMFVEKPKGGPGKGTFSVRNYYMSPDGKDRVLAELVEYTILVRPSGYLLIWDSTFSSDSNKITIGDQEEMGLGIRLNTAVNVEYGEGQITNAEGMKDEEGTWGKASDWIDYSGPVDDKYIGMAIMPSPDNFRSSWYHARNYGFVAANPFGRAAMEQGEKSEVTVSEGDEFELGFGIFVYCTSTGEKLDVSDAYQDYLDLRK